jgi:hypothetical protein
MKRAALLCVVIFVTAVAVYLLKGRHPENLSPSSVLQVAPSAPASRSGALITKTAVPTPAPNVAPYFTQFLAEDSQLLESMHVNAAAAEARENEIAAKMGEAEVAYARELALAPQAPANRRILAVDLLGRAPSRLTGPALDDIITRGMNSARAEPHSIEELSNVQAKSFALMAIDAIAEKAIHDPGERAHLHQLDAGAKDSTIKKYIEERIRSLPRL